MQELEARLLKIKAMLYALLTAFACILAATVFLASKETALENRISLGWCGNAPGPVAGERDAYSRGKDLFVLNCASCHNRNMKDDLTGPALSGVRARWSGFPKKDLYGFIRHSQKMIKQKHPRALELWKANQPALMSNFPSLTDEDLKDLLTYVDSDPG